MRFEEFVKKAKEWMQDWLGTDAQVRTKMMRKNNGAAYTGLHDESREVSAVIYLEPIYQKYLENGETEEAFEKAMEEIKERYGKADRGEEIRRLLKGFGNFETVKGNLAFRLVSQAKNRELLRDIPHVDFLDLAVVFEVYLGLDGKNAYSIVITNEDMNTWNMDAEELYRTAMANAPIVKPASLRGLKEALGVRNAEGEREMFYVLTNEPAAYGAAAMLYEGVLRKASNQLGGDLVILPSSIHEVLLAPWISKTDSRAMKEIVRRVNETEVPDEEQLSDHVYWYIRSEDRIEIAE